MTLDISISRLTYFCERNPRDPLVDSIRAVLAEIASRPAAPRPSTTPPRLKARNARRKGTTPMPPGLRAKVEVAVRVVSEMFGADPEEVACGLRRTKRLTVPRHVSICLLRELTVVSLPQLGAAFSLHHTSILHAEGRAGRLRDEIERARPAVVAALAEVGR